MFLYLQLSQIAEKSQINEYSDQLSLHQKIVLH